MAQLLFQGSTAAEIEAALADVPPHPKRDALRSLLAGRERQIDALAAEVAATAANHDASGPTPEQGIARIAAFFDRAVAHSPEASVALYSLGDPAILAAATAEIIAWLEAHARARTGQGHARSRLRLRPGRRGAGAALPVRARPRRVFRDGGGSPTAAGRARQPSASRKRAARTSPSSRTRAFDAVLAIDSFPYMVQAGVAARHVTDAGAYPATRRRARHPQPLLPKRRRPGPRGRSRLGGGHRAAPRSGGPQAVPALGRVRLRAAAVIRLLLLLVLALPAYAQDHRGGTLRLLARTAAGTLDPQVNYTAQYWQLYCFTHDGLVAFRKAPGPGRPRDSCRTSPTPVPEDEGGLTYTFRLRPGIRFSDGAPLRPEDVVASFRRLFRVRSPTAETFYGAIDGADECLPRPTPAPSLAWPPTATRSASA